MVHATAGTVRAVHTYGPLISSIIHVHHDGLLSGKLMKQLINKRFDIKYAAEIAVWEQSKSSQLEILLR